MSFCNVTCRYVILLKAFETWIIVLCNFLASHVTVSHFFSSLFLYHFHFLSNRWSRLLNKNNKKESESRNEIFFTRNVKRVLNPLCCRRRRWTNSWDGNVKTTSSFSSERLILLHSWSFLKTVTKVTLPWAKSVDSVICRQINFEFTIALSTRYT